MTALVEVRNVSMRFGAHAALDDVSLQIPAGSYVVLLGPSGSGKTTLLNILGGFLEPSAGSVSIAGEDVTRVAPAQRPTATVFQDYALFPHMTVAANVEFGLRMRKVERMSRERRALELLGLVGLEQVAGRRPHELSGGQRQRVALARALVIEPKLLLLDEPLGALDLRLRRQMQDELRSIRKRIGMTFVHVTHDQEEAMALADVVIVMNAGRIEDMGSPDRVYARPESRFAATFMGESNIIEGTVRRQSPDGLEIRTSLGEFKAGGQAQAGDTVAIALRPECLHLEPGGQKVADVVVGDIAFQGAFLRVTTTAPQQRMFHLRLAPGTAVRPGDRVSLYARTEDIVVLTR